MEANEISTHQVKIFRFLEQHAGWLTSKEVAAGTGVAERTARKHLLTFVHLGMLDQAEVFPGHRYRLSTQAAKRNIGYLNRLQTACEVFGL